MYKFMLFSIFVVLLAFFIFTCQEAPTVSEENSSGLEFDGIVTPNPGGYIPPPTCGRMTGGGSVFFGEDPRVRVTRGFELHCCYQALPNNLQVNWLGGNKFHLLELTDAYCEDTDVIQEPPAAPFDTYYGWGNGRLNNVPGATIEFVFTDAGEPGKNDYASILIWDANGTLVLDVAGNIEVGNLQAHAD